MLKEVECDETEHFDACFRATEKYLGVELVAGSLDNDVIASYKGEVVMKWDVDRGIIVFNDLPREV